MKTIRDDPGTLAHFGAAQTGAMPSVPGYEILELVGRGGMGKVYRAKNIALGRIVALKVLAQEPDDKLLARFREECRAVARLQHPNIAQFFETGLADGQPFYTQEFLEGGSLAQSFDGKPQEPRSAAQVVETLARAIQHSHDHGILHRDLKPANILLAVDGTPKVTDFGLAKQIASATGAAETAAGNALTRTGEIVGTPNYMPPEQASGVVSQLGPGADVYGLGAILYDALTGRPPITGPDPLQTLLLVLSMDPVSPSKLQPGVPRDLETICLKALEKSPKKRYRSAGEMADDLHRFLVGEPILARPVGFFERTAKWARRNKWKARALGLLVALGLFVFVGLAVGLVWVSAKNREVEDANNNLETRNKELKAAKEATDQANQNLTVAKDETEKTLALALQSLDYYYFQISEDLHEVPRGEELRIKVLAQARKLLDHIHEFRPDDPNIRAYQIEGFDKLGNAEMAVGKVDDALKDYKRSSEIAADLEKRFPNEPAYRRYRVLADTKIASQFRMRGNSKDADALLATVKPTLAELVAAHPDDPKIWALEYAVTMQLIGAAVQAEKDDEAERHYRRIIELAGKIAAKDPSERTQIDLIEWHSKLANFLLIFGPKRLDEAEAELKEAERGLKEFENSKSVGMRVLRAQVFSSIGSLRDKRMKWQEAADAYGVSEKAYAALAEDFPAKPIYRYKLAETLFAAGLDAAILNHLDEATKQLQRAIGLLDQMRKDYPDDRGIKSLHERISMTLAQFAKLPKADKKP